MILVLVAVCIDVKDKRKERREVCVNRGNKDVGYYDFQSRKCRGMNV